ncbi:MAG: CRTAC1 family protein [Acidobacteria bacterium]|nr:CRTAC1 family protein [Acidobacteriota bacterium]
MKTLRWLVAAAIAGTLIVSAPAADNSAPAFELVQPELFSAPGGMPNAWADFDNDGQLDEFVGFRGRPNRLYKQNHGRFEDVAASAGVADNIETRAAAWGDYDGDGHVDLYVGFVSTDRGAPNKLYHSDGHGHFTDVAPALGLNLTGVTRQVSWIDYDNDGDLDLFVVFRDKPNRLFRNDGGRFTDVTSESGIGDPRKTVGAVWFDMDGDGDLDLFVANQNGDTNGLFRNDGGRESPTDRAATPVPHFVDVAREWGVDAPRRSEEFGGVGPAVADFDGDGLFDLFVANYGPSALYRNDRGRRFVDVTKAAGLLFDQHATTPSWGDYDNDGRPDLYVAGFLADVTHYPDHLFHNEGGAFRDVLPALVNEHDASHGVQWIDYDNDGAVDLALTNNDPRGGHYLFRNLLPATRARQSLSIDVVDARGRRTRAGAEVRVYAAGTRRLISSGLVDTGGGYCSQNVVPVHVATADAARVDVEVTSMSRAGRKVTARRGLRIEDRGLRIEVRIPN